MDKQSSATVELNLLRKVARGDKEAFRSLYDLTHQGVYYFLTRLMNDDGAAEDVLVDTFTEVWRGAGRFAGKSQVRTWIFSIARNQGLNALRKRKDCDMLDDHPNISDGDTEYFDTIDRKAFIKKALGTVSNKHREILELTFFHDMTYPEVAEILSIPVATVKTRVFYAKKALKETLAEMGVADDAL